MLGIFAWPGSDCLFQRRTAEDRFFLILGANWFATELVLVSPRGMGKLLTLSFLSSALLFTACGDKKGGEKQNELTRQANGSPVSAELIEFTGEGEQRKNKIHLQNFGEKKAGGYMLLMKYFDEAGNAIVLQKGTQFEKEFDFTGLSGNKYSVDAKSHATIEIAGMVPPPDNAKNVKLVFTRVDSIEAGKIVPWWSAKFSSGWPSE